MIFNFFNTLIPENERINDINDNPNIINYLSIISKNLPSFIINEYNFKKIIFNEKYINIVLFIILKNNKY